MGPMRAAREFVSGLKRDGLLAKTEEIAVRLYGSLALTGVGHGTDRAILAGLEGAEPESVDPDSIEPTLGRIRSSGRLRLLGEREIAFDEPMQLLFMQHERLPRHSNGMRFTALGAGHAVLREEDYYSIGGGFIVRGDETEAPEAHAHAPPPYPFSSGDELLALCREHGLEMFELILANERTWAKEARGAREAAAHLAGDAGLRRARLSPERAPARSAQGAPPCAAAVPAADRERHGEAARRHGLGERLRTRGERGERRRRSRRHRTDQRRGRHRAGGAAFLSALRGRRQRRGRHPLPAGGRRHGHALQAQRLDLRCRDGLSGRGRASPARWPRPAWWPRSTAPTSRSRTPPRSAWSTTSGSPATRWRDWCRFPASSATPWGR